MMAPPVKAACLVSLALFSTAAAGDLPLPDFAAPPTAARPKFRYWLPDASVVAEAVAADVASLAVAGAGGLELLPFYNYGQPPVSTDWSVYGFGTPAFAALFRAVLASVNGTAALTGGGGGPLTLDFAVGANQAAGVPAPAPPADGPAAKSGAGKGLAMELVYGAAPLPSGAGTAAVSLPPPVVHFNYEPLQGFINAPELWGDSRLVAALAVQVVEERRGRDGASAATTLAILNETSVVDLTDRVVNGTLAGWTAPATGGTWRLLAFYERYTNERSCVSTPGAASWVGNGSWMVDHFSAAGALAVTDFWDTHLLDEETRALLRRVGGYSWEDSMEMMAALWWTPGFLDRFRQRRGYSAVPFLPVFFQAANLWNGYGAPYNTTYAFDRHTTDGGRYVEDYRLTLNEGYQDFLRHYQTWAEGLGLAHSCQPSYNLPLDMTADIPLVGAPELESLGFSESIDNYLQFTGAAHLAGRTTVSTEIGAQRIGAYAQTVPALLRVVRDSFAAGVNTLVLHGYPYSGPYPGTTWPGYTPFQFEFCEMWGPRQPAWLHLNDTLLFAARNTLVLKTGVPRVDLAFYAWQVPFSARQQRSGGPAAALTAAGYTHEYVGPHNLVLARASARSGVLSPDGPAYKALVILNDNPLRITPDGSAALLDLAAAGLPIIVVQPSTGGAANFSVSATTVGMRGQAAVAANLQQLFNGSFATVRSIAQSQLTPELLTAAGIAPRVRVDAVSAVSAVSAVAAVAGAGPRNASQLFTHWRSDTASGKEFVYVLNRGLAATFALSFAASSHRAVPYVLDAWTGEQTVRVVYSWTDDGRLAANITLSQEESCILAFVPRGEASAALVRRRGGPAPSVAAHSLNIAQIRLDAQGRFDVLVRDHEEAYLRLAGDTTVAVPRSSRAASPSLPVPVSNTILGPWNLSVDAFAAPAMLTTASVAPNRTTIVVPTPVAVLKPWTQIRGLEHVSGLGTYVAAFEVSRSSSNETAFTLHLTGRILHTLRVFVNGVAVPPFDPAVAADAADDDSPRGGRDITALLHSNTANDIRIEVASSLFNAVKARAADVRSVGLGTRVPRYYTEAAWADFGLVGDVVVRQWRRVVVEV